MADVIQPATSGRAKCRGCGRPIAAGELRFGESLPNPYGEGDAVYWLHLPCAACMRPEKLLPTLASSDAPIADPDWLREAAELGIQHRRLPRLSHAERSKSGRARCRSCREAIPGGVWRLALQMFEEGRFSPIGYLHVECAEAYLGTTSILDRIRRLTPDIDDAAAAEISELLEHQRPGPAVEEDAADGAAEGEAVAAPSAGPDVAKTRPLPEDTTRRVRES